VASPAVHEIGIQLSKSVGRASVLPSFHAFMPTYCGLFHLVKSYDACYDVKIVKKLTFFGFQKQSAFSSI
jgi:hypothetical protein